MWTTGKARNPLKWIWNQAKRIFRRGPKTVKPATRIRDELIERKGFDEASKLALQLETGEVSTARWVLNMRRLIRNTYVGQYALGKGGIQNMTPQDFSSLGGMLKEQYGYLNNFANDINAGKLSTNGIAARSQMYVSSGREAFERAAARAAGAPELPAYPGDGSTRCLTSCRCNWSIAEFPDHWEATWHIDRAAENCPDCQERAKVWAPYVIRKVPEVPMGPILMPGQFY